jgi:hypothetical protein
MKNSATDIVIIGAGIAGLAAGCYAQLQVSLGVNRDLSAAPHWVTHLLDEPVLIAGEERYEIGVNYRNCGIFTRWRSFSPGELGNGWNQAGVCQ